MHLLKKIKEKFQGYREKFHQHLIHETTTQQVGSIRRFSDKVYIYFKKKAEDPASFSLTIITTLFIVFVVWASLFHIDESVRGNGKIIPSKYVQIIDNLEGGIIRDILVQEGEIVKKDQPIIKLDTTQTAAKLDEIKRDYSKYQLTANRLKSQLKNVPFTPSEEIQKQFPDFVAQETGRYKTDMDQLSKETNIVEAEVKSKEHELKEKQEKLLLDKKHLALVTEQGDMIASLYKKGLSSKLKHITAQREIVNLKNEVSSSEELIPKLEAEVERTKSQLKKVKIDFDDECEKNLQDAELKLSELQSNKSIYEDRLNRQEITAPIDGIVKEINVKTLGGTIKAGQSIMTIVPLNDELLAEIKITPNDIGFIKPDSPVIIKVGAYDYTIYGSLPGKVTYISADTIEEKQGNELPDKSFFRIKVKADKNYIERDDHKFYLTPGMAVDVDIHTGRRTIMSYILKPILKTMHQAFTER